MAQTRPSVMATFLDIPYAKSRPLAGPRFRLQPCIVFGAVYPIDFYAARTAWLPAAIDLARSSKPLLEGWTLHFRIFAFLDLDAAFIEAGGHLRLSTPPHCCWSSNQLRKPPAAGSADFKDFAESCGALVSPSSLALAGVVWIYGARWRVSGHFVRPPLPMILLFTPAATCWSCCSWGALTSFISGIRYAGDCAYIFLAYCPFGAGVESMAAEPDGGCHMFILYWGMSSFITAPVAIWCLSPPPP